MSEKTSIIGMVLLLAVIGVLANYTDQLVDFAILKLGWAPAFFICYGACMLGMIYIRPITNWFANLKVKPKEEGQ